MAALIPALLLAGCDLPRDPDGTSDRVAAEGSFRVGLVARGEDRRGAAEQAAFLARLAATSHARPQIREGAMEPLLAMLEAGALDVVVGHFAETSPWEKRVTLAEPLATLPGVGGAHRLAAAVRNGENAWLMRVDRVSREGARAR